MTFSTRSMRRRRRRSTSARKRRQTRATGELSALERERITCSLSKWTGEPGCCQWCNAEITSARRRTWCSDPCGRAWQRNHIWRFARSAAKRRAKYFCERPSCDAARRDCEVNHRAARNGAGYGPGCHHHLSPDSDGRGGLEVLCRAHHREITTAQAKERAALRRAARDAASAADPGDAATDSSS
ncbi:MAG: hypothetical protein ACO32X_06750, partial [Ilumatobacteraceae bacterium]